MSKTTNRRSEVKKGTVIAIIVLAIIAIVGGTYARYSATSYPNASLTIAKWSVAFKTNGAPISETNKVTFTVDSNSNIAANRIAPGYSAVGNAQIDLTGTEVSVDLKVSVDPDDVAAAFGDDVAERINVQLKVNGELANSDTATVNYSSIASNPVTNIQVVITWDDANSTMSNAADTVLGAAGATKTIPVTLTATQHV